ncbi:hypothetical protein [Streptomyces sp. NPDC020917]|uniref:hypothetical protein n=1 Tax=Streptomyces sp. NPDC020917 TaxID=3365102 RepID=UPI003788D085
MAHPRKDVRYNFAAAEDLSWALKYLSTRLHDVARLRSKLRAADLDCPDMPPASVPWRGQNWNDFRDHFDAEQAALAHFATEAMRLKSQVDAATESALRARSEKH